MSTPPRDVPASVPQWNSDAYSTSRSLYSALSTSELAGHLSSLAANTKFNTITPETRCALLDEAASRDVPACRPLLLQQGHLRDTQGHGNRHSAEFF